MVFVKNRCNFIPIVFIINLVKTWRYMYYDAKQIVLFYARTSTRNLSEGLRVEKGPI